MSAILMAPKLVAAIAHPMVVRRVHLEILISACTTFTTTQALIPVKAATLHGFWPNFTYATASMKITIAPGKMNGEPPIKPPLTPCRRQPR